MSSRVPNMAGVVIVTTNDQPSALSLNNNSPLQGRINELEQQLAEHKELIETLQRQEHRFRSLIETGGHLVWITTPTGEAILDLPYWCDYTGQSLAEATGFGYINAIHPDDVARVRAAFRAAAAQHNVYKIEYRIRRADGVYRSFAVRAVPVMNADGSVCEWVGTCTDNTDRKRAEAALQRSEERYRSIVLASSVVWVTNAEGMVVEDLPSWRAYTGQSEAEVIGAGWLAAIHPVDREATNAVWMEAVQSKSVFVNEQRIKRYDGEYRYFAVRGVPVLDQNGEIREWVGTCTDITERKHATSALLEWQQRYELVVAVSGQVVYDYDVATGGITWSGSVQQVLGYDHADMHGGIDQWMELIHPDDSAEAVKQLEVAEQACAPYLIEYRFKHQDGRYLWMMDRGLFIPDQAGKAIRMIGAMQDITAQKQAQDEARASQQRLAGIVDLAEDAIISIDDQHRISMYNRGAEKIFGYTADEALGMPIDMLLPERFRAHHGQQVRDYANSADGGRAMGQRRELWGQRKNGQEFAAEASISKLVQDGHVILNVILRDITERIRAEEEQRRLQDEIIQMQAASLAELSTPLIPISDQIVVMPLIGAIDTSRVQNVIDTLLRGVAQSRAQVAILDITGVPVVDTQVANGLLQAAQAVSLLGARVILTGIRPEVAQTLVQLGVNLNTIVTRSSLQSGIAYATGREF